MVSHAEASNIYSEFLAFNSTPMSRGVLPFHVLDVMYMDVLALFVSLVYCSGIYLVKIGKENLFYCHVGYILWKFYFCSVIFQMDLTSIMAINRKLGS